LIYKRERKKERKKEEKNENYARCAICINNEYQQTLLTVRYRETNKIEWLLIRCFLSSTENYWRTRNNQRSSVLLLLL